MRYMDRFDWLVFELTEGGDVATKKQLDAVLSLYDIELEKLAATVATDELEDQVYEGISYDDLQCVVMEADSILNNFHGWLFDRHSVDVDTWQELENYLNMADYVNKHPKWDFYIQGEEVSKNIQGNILVITKEGKIKGGNLTN